MKSTRFSRQFCPNCFVCGSYLYRREGDRVRGAGLEKRVNPSHAVRSMPCPSPFSARTPPSGGFFRPSLPPTAPKPRRFRPAAPLLSRQNPAGSRRFRAAAARFSRFPPGTAPRLPPETRPLCAVSRQTRPLLPRQPGFFPLCARALPVIPPVLRPKAPRAPPKSALRTRRRPELGSRWGFHPARLRRGEACTPQGGLNPWARFSGDRRPVAYEISQNSRLFSGLACGWVRGFQPIDIAPGCAKRKSPEMRLEVHILLP